MKSLLRYKILTLLAGVATASVIIFSQLFYFQAASYCQKKAESTQHDQKADSPETHVSIPSSSISSTSHFEIQQDLSFVLEILFEREAEAKTITNIGFPVNRFFQTLFRSIISPNAP